MNPIFLASKPHGFLTQQNRLGLGPVLDELLAGLNEAGDLGGIEDLMPRIQWIASGHLRINLLVLRT